MSGKPPYKEPSDPRLKEFTLPDGTSIEVNQATSNALTKFFMEYAMGPEEFIEFFRDDEQLNTLSADHRMELFLHALVGNSDLTKELLDEVLTDYDGGSYDEHLEVIDWYKPGFVQSALDEIAYCALCDFPEYMAETCNLSPDEVRHLLKEVEVRRELHKHDEPGTTPVKVAYRKKS